MLTNYGVLHYEQNSKEKNDNAYMLCLTKP